MSNILFQNALKRISQKTPPIWFMRQAGRYHSHYQNLKEKYSFEKLCKNPELASEVACGPVNEFDFDIALVSCGGFGMITSNYIFNELNKNVMYIGGGLQLYFGIKGNRWNTRSTISKLMNDKWCNVKNEDKPKYPKLCENSCYW